MPSATVLPSELPNMWREQLRTAIRAAIRDMRRAGTVGASPACLQQCTSTRGLTCPSQFYHVHFAQLAREVAAAARFPLNDPDHAYLALIAIAGERVRTGGWTMADALAFGTALQDRFTREYGRSLRM